MQRNIRRKIDRMRVNREWNEQGKYEYFDELRAKRPSHAHRAQLWTEIDYRNALACQTIRRVSQLENLLRWIERTQAIDDFTRTRIAETLSPMSEV